MRKERSNPNPKGIVKSDFQKNTSIQAKVTRKVRKSFYNIEMFSNSFFTFLERTSIITTSIFRTIYKISSPGKKGVLLQMRSIFSKEYFNKVEVTLLHGCSPVNCLNIHRTPFLKNTPEWLLLYIWKWIQYMPAGIHLFIVKIEKLKQGVKYIQS